MTLQRYDISPDDLVEIKEHSPVGDYFSIESGGQSIILHDIVTLEPLKGTETPPGLLADTNLRQGLNFLSTQGAKGCLGIQLVLAPHGSAQDFARIRKEHAETLDVSSVVALEISSLKGEPQLNEHPGRREFQRAELDWAQSVGKVVLPCELALDDTSTVARRLGHLWNNVYQPTLQDTNLTSGARNAAALISEAAYQRMRQPCILARMGHLLSKLLDGQTAPAEKLSVPMIVGSWHKNDEHRLRALGVECEVFETTPKPTYSLDEWDIFGSIIMRITHTSRATLRDLSIVPPYLADSPSHPALATPKKTTER